MKHWCFVKKINEKPLPVFIRPDIEMYPVGNGQLVVCKMFRYMRAIQGKQKLRKKNYLVMVLQQYLKNKIKF